MSYPANSLANELYVALLSKDFERARVLLKGRAINEPLTDHDCALHVACAAQRIDFVRYLVEECGADVNIEADHHYTPIDVTWWHAEGPNGYTRDSGLEIAGYLSSKGGISKVMRK